MVGSVKSEFVLVQRLGFFVDYENSECLQAILSSFDKDKINKAVFRMVHVLSDLIEGSYSAYGLRMIEALNLKSMKEVWTYRSKLIKKFNVDITDNLKTPVWIQSSSSSEHSYMKFFDEIKKSLPSDYYIEGVSVSEQNKNFNPSC